MFDLKKPINQLALMLFLLGMGIILASVAIAFVPQNNDLQNVNMLRISQRGQAGAVFESLATDSRSLIITIRECQGSQA